MEVDDVAGARVQRGEHQRLTVFDDPDVRDEALVEDRVDRLAVMAAALPLAAQSHPIRDTAARRYAVNSHAR